MELRDLESDRARLIQQLSREIQDQRVLDAMSHIPREDFVPAESRHLSYQDAPLPIKSGQTISQPYIVALMTQALELKGDERVLEVGTGSGYQTAILAETAGYVVTVERHSNLVEEARSRLDTMGYKNIDVHRAAEGVMGWPEGAPYDAVLTTAGAPRVPQALLDQLKDEGRIVIPVGSRNEQELLVVVKHGDRISRTSLGACRFVPLIGDEAWEE